MNLTGILLWSLGVLLAALVPSLLAPIILGIGAGISLLAFVVALGHALMGLPVAFLVTKSGWMNIASAAIGGFAIGVVPMGALVLFDLGQGFAIPMSDVVRTLGLLGALGSLGGVTLWLVLYIGGEPRVRPR